MLVISLPKSDTLSLAILLLFALPAIAQRVIYEGLEGSFKNHDKQGVPWGANLQIVAGFADLDGDGKADLIVLQDRVEEKPAQSLAIYKLNKTVFVPVEKVALPAERLAFLLEGIRNSSQGKEILLRTATPTECNDGGDYQAAGTSEIVYFFRDRMLKEKR
jgi:hypothetical protein